MQEIREYEQLKVSISPNRQEMGEKAAELAKSLLLDLLKEKDEVNIMFAAAPSQNEFLAELAAAQEIDWSRVNAFHMDEYIGLSPEHPAAFRSFLNRAIFSKVPFKNVFLIDEGKVANPGDEDKQKIMDEYTRLLREYPLDMVLMGIGENGHIAFNDPPVADFRDPLDIKVVALDDISRQQQVHDGCFTTLDEVPTHAYTVTIPPMMRATYRVCIVPSLLKANAVRATLEDEISTRIPASILRTQNSNLFIDQDAASALSK